jgi:hypothetical protein
MTENTATPAPAPRSKPSSKKEFSGGWFLAITVGVVVTIVMLAAGALLVSDKPAPTQVVASNAKSETTPPAQPPTVPPTKPTTPAPATGEGSTAKVEVKAEGGKLRVDFDPCPCRTCTTTSAPSKAPKGQAQSRKPVTPPVTTPVEKKSVHNPPSGGSQLAWRHPDAEAGKGPRECFFEKVDRSHLEQYAKYCNKGVVYPKKNEAESRTTWTERVNAHWSEKYRKEGEPVLVKPKELDSITYKVRPGT